MRLIALFVVLSCLAGCVSEGTDPISAKKDGPGPVEMAEHRVAKYVARLPNLYGTRLLQIMQEIIAYKQLALNPVIAALPAADVRTQANLLYILGFVGGGKAHDAVIPHLKSKDAGVRFESAVALLTMGDWGGVPTLLTFMESSDRRHRFKASEALKQVVKKDLGFQFDAPLPEREQALARWRGWWSGQREALISGKKPPKPATGVSTTGN